MVISCYEMTMSIWSVAEAKARFATLVARAGKSPQRITRRGRPVAVVTGIDASGQAHQATTPHPMRDFLGRCAELRGTDDLGLVLPPRKSQRPRPNPFGTRR
jgi:prevent-host-death family protein